MNRIIVYFLSGCLGIVGCNHSMSDNMKKIKFHSNIVVAHRGAWKALGMPENSISSLKQAIYLKCAGSEFDVHMTADDSLVINHDEKFQGLDIETHTLDELNKFRLSNGESIPTLRTYLTQGMKNNPGTRIVMEIKPSSISVERGKLVANKVFELVHELKAADWITYISFDLEILKSLIALDKKVSTQYLNGELSPIQLKTFGISGIDYNLSVFKNHPEWIKEAKDNKMILNVWTVNTASDMDYFIRQGFDFITTNEPELLFEKLKAKGIK